MMATRRKYHLLSGGGLLLILLFACLPARAENPFLQQAVNAYEIKSYDGHADMLITQKRAINAKEGSFYHGKIKSISAEIVPSSHKNLFIGDIGLVAKFVKNALHS